MTDAVTLPHIVVIGKMGAGKSTVANMLATHFGYQTLSFATGVRDVTERLYGAEFRNSRPHLQAIGAGLRRIDPDVWVSAWERSYAATYDFHGEALRVAVDDCRYPNEVEHLHSYAFRFVAVVADEAVRIDRLKRTGKLTDLDQLQHESETALDDYAVPTDEIFMNNPLDDLSAQVLAYVNRVRS